MRELVVYTLMFSAMLQLLMAAYTWGRRNEPAAKPLILVFLIGFIWALAYGIEIASNDIQVKIASVKIVYVIVSFGPLAFLLLTFEHLGIEHLLTRRRLALLILPSLVIIALVLTPRHNEMFEYGYTLERIGSLDVLLKKHGILYTPVMLSLQGISIITYYFLLRSLSSANQIKQQQTITILSAMFILFIVNAITILDVSPIKGFDFTPHALVVSGGLFAVAIFRYRWLDILPLARTTLVEVIPVGVVVLDAKDRIVDINPSAQRFLQVNATIVGKESREVFTNFMTLSPTRLDKMIFIKEARVEMLNGQVEHFEIQSMPLMDRAGQISGQIVMLHNITERKQEELHLLQLTLAVDQSPTAVVIINPNAVIEYVNPQFTSLTGYSREEAIGKNISIIDSMQTPDPSNEEMWKTIKAGNIWRGEILNRKKNGEYYWDATVIAPVKDGNGAIVNFIAIKEDITTQKNAEVALRKSEAELRETNLQLENKIEKITALEAELRHQTIRDPLTGLYNRRYMIESIELEFQLTIFESQPLSIILMDIDHFKELNDTYGHLAGDAFLKATADILHYHIRKSDVAFRYGGEEFLLVLKETDLETAVQRAEEFRLLFENAVLRHQNQKIRVTASFGVTSYPAHPSTGGEEMISKADWALYESKRLGRNKVTVWQAG
ncbi:MAG: diguanylate cyclase [Anaerolineales bacterium]|nr:diguanylate cyclase [Anaerolineales bacterium]